MPDLAVEAGRKAAIPPANYRPASNNSLAHLLKVSRVPVFFPRVASWHGAPRRSLDVPANALVVIAATGELSRNVAWRWAGGRIGVKRGK
jgi:hypothetical protein